MFPAGRNHDTSAGIFFGSSQKVRGANKGLGEAPKSCTRKEHESATNSIARRGQGAMPLAGSRDSVPCGVWGNAPTVPRQTSISNALNKGAGSEASLPVTLRVRRRAPQLLFPQDSVMNLFFCLTASIRHDMMKLQPFFYFCGRKVVILFPNENAPRCEANFSRWLTRMKRSVAALR